MVTMDALGGQQASAPTLLAQEAAYVLTRKATQGLLDEEGPRFFAWAQQRQFAAGPHESYHTLDGNPGRVEERHYWVVAELAWLTAKSEWAGLGSLGMVERQRTVAGKTTVEVHDYLTSWAGRGQQVGAAVRTHWGVENGLPWGLDVAFQEDQSRLRRDQAAENVRLAPSGAQSPAARIDLLQRHQRQTAQGCLG
jgi:predicted transposase YbfD/YdcC